MFSKSHLAIAHAHQTSKESPQTWVLSLHASSAARFELGVRDFFDVPELHESRGPTVNIFQLLRTWLRDKSNGTCLVILDNTDDASFFLKFPATAKSPVLGCHPSCFGECHLDYVPTCDHRRVDVMTRSKAAALELGDAKNSVLVRPMDEEMQQSSWVACLKVTAVGKTPPTSQARSTPYHLL